MVDSPTHALWRRLERLPAFARAADPDAAPWQLIDLAAAAGLVAIATLLRLIADPYLPPGFPFLTYFPCVIIAAFVFGTAGGTVAAVLGALAAWYFFIPPVRTFSIDMPIAVALGFYLLVTVVDLGLIHFSIRAYGEQARIRRQLLRLAEEKKLIDREIDHRVKNLFSLISALVNLSQRESSTPADMAERLRGRIIAMSRSHSLMRISPDGVVDLAPALSEALAPFAVGQSVLLEGPQLKIGGNAALQLSMVMYELATNAAKYGSLATEGGKIRVCWQVSPGEAGDSLRFHWSETGGPPPPDDAGAGFGSELCRRLVQGLGGTLSVTIAPTGLAAELVFPTASLLSPPAASP